MKSIRQIPSDFFVYYLTIKGEVNRKLIHECRCDERLKDKGERPARLSYTVFLGGLEHVKIKVKIKTRLTDERFESVMGEILEPIEDLETIGEYTGLYTVRLFIMNR